jgi:oxygen-independent coproporphyrinogen III oxidase
LAGIYIHVPFCKRRCYYCDFYSSVKLELIHEYIEALRVEAVARVNYLMSNDLAPVIETVYFGGGTPSLLDINDYKELMQNFAGIFKISLNAEITVEINPDDAEKELLIGLKALGINRLSIGVQSFSDAALKFMNRRHNSIQAFRSIENAILAGFSNISIDLIYGLPGMSVKKWDETLKQAIKLPVNHLSAYHLTYEKGSKLYSFVSKGQISPISETISLRQFELLHDIMESSGFEHYEISNFAKENMYSIHNLNYWKGEKYLGLGPSAHSYDGTSRRWNISDIIKYCKAIKKGEVYWETEQLNKNSISNEYIMTRLRTKWGMDLNYFENEFGRNRFERLIMDVQPYFESGHCNQIKDNIMITHKGWIISDRIISDLMSI